MIAPKYLIYDKIKEIRKCSIIFPSFLVYKKLIDIFSHKYILEKQNWNDSLTIVESNIKDFGFFFFQKQKKK